MMTNINALCEKSKVLTIQDGGIYSEYWALNHEYIRIIFLFMFS